MIIAEKPKFKTKRLISRKPETLHCYEDFQFDYTDSANPNFNTASSYQGYKEATKTDIFLISISLIFLLYDIASDCNLMVTYYIENKFLWFLLTLLFVLIPAMFMTIFSLIMYWSDKHMLSFSRIGWTIRIFLNLLLVAPIVRCFDTLMNGLRSMENKSLEEKDKYYHYMIYEDTDTSYLRLLESVTESTPQLLLQLFILFTQPKVDKLYLIIFQIISCLSSSVSPPICLASYNSALRRSDENKKQMNAISYIFLVIWKFLFILPRLLAIVLFMTVFKWHILIFFGCHYLIMIIYLFSEKTEFFVKDKYYTIKESLFAFVMAFVFCIDFVSVKEGHTRFKCLLFYALSFVEICMLVILWYFNPPIEVTSFQSFSNSSYNPGNSSDQFGFATIFVNTSSLNFTSYYNVTLAKSKYYYQLWPQNVRFFVALSIVGMFLLAVVFMIVYYMWLHPTRNIKVFLRKNSNKGLMDSRKDDMKMQIIDE